MCFGATSCGFCGVESVGATLRFQESESLTVDVGPARYRCNYEDTKAYVLEGLYEVLQSCGEEVGPAWPLVLAMLKGVAQDEVS